MDYICCFRIFAEFAEKLVDRIAENPSDVSSNQVLNLMLICVGHHEWEVGVLKNYLFIYLN